MSPKKFRLIDEAAPKKLTGTVWVFLAAEKGSIFDIALGYT